MLDDALESIELEILECVKYMKGGITFETMDGMPLSRVVRIFDHIGTIAKRESDAYKKARRNR